MHSGNSRRANSRLGMVLFLIYLSLYGSFVVVNAFSPSTMEATPVAGVNLAILFGFGLIIMAFLLALIYGMFCGDEPNDGEDLAANDRSRQDGEGQE